jgi:hypothetical protein
MADAKKAATRTLHDLKSHAAEVLDVRDWTKRYPFPAVGVAAVGGFLASLIASRAKKKSNGTAPEPNPKDCPQPAPARKERGWMTTLAWAGADLIKSAIVASLKAPQPPPSGDGNVNGSQRV